MTMAIDSFTKALAALRRTPAEGGAPPAGAWPLARAIHHVTLGVEYSLDGYPVLRSALFRATVGRIAAARFLRAGVMRHDCAKPLPGEPEGALPSLDDAQARLEAAVARFQRHAGPLAPHFAFGVLDKARYERVHAMHLADHLRVYGPPVPEPEVSHPELLSAL